MFFFSSCDQPHTGLSRNEGQIASGGIPLLPMSKTNCHCRASVMPAAAVTVS